MATCSSILAWKFHGQGPGRLQPFGLQLVRHGRAAEHKVHLRVFLASYTCQDTILSKELDCDHFSVHTNTRSLCCMPETNKTLYVNYVASQVTQW